MVIINFEIDYSKYLYYYSALAETRFILYSQDVFKFQNNVFYFENNLKQNRLTIKRLSAYFCAQERTRTFTPRGTRT